MKHCLWLFLTASLALLAPSCQRQIEEDDPAAGPSSEAVEAQEEPLLLDEPAPLLLEEGAEAPQGVEAAAALNWRCHVCHLNYAEEAFSLRHAVGDVGCEDCHGSSDAHCSDEDNITPPDIMYPRAKITAACMKCHPEPGPENHKEILEDLASVEMVCSDCHAVSHRLGHRTRRWDKATGKLIEDDDVRMMTDEMLEEG